MQRYNLYRPSFLISPTTAQPQSGVPQSHQAGIRQIVCSTLGRILCAGDFRESLAALHRLGETIGGWFPGRLLIIPAQPALVKRILNNPLHLALAYGSRATLARREALFPGPLLYLVKRLPRWQRVEVVKSQGSVKGITLVVGMKKKRDKRERAQTEERLPLALAGAQRRFRQGERPCVLTIDTVQIAYRDRTLDSSWLLRNNWSIKGHRKWRLPDAEPDDPDIEEWTFQGRFHRDIVQTTAYIGGNRHGRIKIKFEMADILGLPDNSVPISPNLLASGSHSFPNRKQWIQGVQIYKTRRRLRDGSEEAARTRRKVEFNIKRGGIPNSASGSSSTTIRPLTKNHRPQPIIGNRETAVRNSSSQPRSLLRACNSL